MKTLLISDENMIGNVRANLRARQLYPAIGERMAHYNAAFDGRIDRIVLTVRTLDLWWRSAASYGVKRGAQPLQHKDCCEISQDSRGWRDVIADLACAAPEAEIVVIPFETYVARPEVLLEHATELNGLPAISSEWLNRSPDLPGLREILRDRGAPKDALATGIGHWNPFERKQSAVLRERYEDDLYWLRGGADGLATFRDNSRSTTPNNGAGRDMETKRGRGNVGEKGSVA